MEPTVQCDFCKTTANRWVDGKTIYGPWANMCMRCFYIYGIGLGIGRGQFYENGKKASGF